MGRAADAILKVLLGENGEKSKVLVKLGDQCMETDPPGSKRSVLVTRPRTSMRRRAARGWRSWARPRPDSSLAGLPVLLRACPLTL